MSKYLFKLTSWCIGFASLYLCVATADQGFKNIGLVILWIFAFCLFLSSFIDVDELVTKSSTVTTAFFVNAPWVFIGFSLVYFNHILLGVFFLAPSLLNFLRMKQKIKELRK